MSHCGGRVSRHKEGSALGGFADLKQRRQVALASLRASPEGQKEE